MGYRALTRAAYRALSGFQPVAIEGAEITVLQMALGVSGAMLEITRLGQVEIGRYHETYNSICSRIGIRAQRISRLTPPGSRFKRPVSSALDDAQALAS